VHAVARKQLGQQRLLLALLDADDPAMRTQVGPTFTWESVDRAEALRDVAGV
jgi:hypothetical protein